MRIKSFLLPLGFSLAVAGAATATASNSQAVQLHSGASESVYEVQNLKGFRLALPGQLELDSIKRIVLDPHTQNLKLVGSTADEAEVAIAVERVRLRKANNYGTVAIEVTTLDGKVIEALAPSGAPTIAVN